ncbi:hypothetical protein [Herbaspirillum rubrisubalbicans]|uniref:hypothetical protein n=1 Tax=Herbaspirillum rubrisubalbicans TaxID=80842 RepID=UPI00073A0902|nr:hypothetical protein [Herbaspirillum rubrisubalbicans]
MKDIEVVPVDEGKLPHIHTHVLIPRGDTLVRLARSWRPTGLTGCGRNAPLFPLAAQVTIHLLPERWPAALDIALRQPCNYLEFPQDVLATLKKERRDLEGAALKNYLFFIFNF